MIKIPTKLTKRDYGKVFLTGFLMAAVILLPSIIYNRGVMLLSNDFNTQQMPFYVLANDQIKSGEIFFSNLTDLGTPFLGSYMFYMLGSPFFWLTLPFPSFMLPYLMGPLLAVKFGIATLTSYIFICRYVKRPSIAIIGALLYAYSGFQIFNTFYNHFHDMTAFFPLMLIALDELVENDRKGWFALTVMLNLSTNYIFFVGQAMFIVAYYVVKIISGDYKFTVRSFIKVAVEAILGMLAAAYVFTAVFFISQNPRTDERLSGWSAFVYNNSMKYVEILRAFLLPTDTPHIEPFFPKDATTRWQSLQAYIPMFSFAGALAIVKAKRKSFVSRLLIICTIVALVPILNSIFYLFNSFYYARWYYMFLLIIALATAISLDNIGEMMPQLRSSMKKIAILQIVFVVVVTFFPRVDNTGVLRIGLSDKSYFGFFIAYTAIALFGSFFVLWCLKFYKKPRRFAHYISVCLVALVIVNGTVNVIAMKVAEGKTNYYANSYINARDALDDIKTDDSFRLDTSRIYYNAHMWWGIPSMATFNSNISGSELAFYEAIGEERFVATMPTDDMYGLRGFLSVKYVVYSKGKKDIMPGLSFYYSKLGYDFYINKNYIPMGFTYDYSINELNFRNITKWKRHISLVQSMVLTDEQVEKYRDVLTPILESEEETPLYLNYNDYLRETEKRKQSVAYNFEWEKNGFSADINLETSELVFFSVPYDEGFTATINGNKAEIERVNIGFMAVLCQPGENHIEFSYKPKGIEFLFIISIISFLAIIAYMLFPRIKRRFRRIDSSRIK